MWVAGGAGLLILVLAYPVKAYFGPDRFHAFIWGAVLSTIIILFAFVSNLWALSRQGQTFLRAVLGGMLARFVMFGAALFCVWKFTSLDLTAFVISLMGFYFVLQFVEVRYIQKTILKR